MEYYTSPHLYLASNEQRLFRESYSSMGLDWRGRRSSGRRGSHSCVIIFLAILWSISRVSSQNMLMSMWTLIQHVDVMWKIIISITIVVFIVGNIWWICRFEHYFLIKCLNFLIFFFDLWPYYFKQYDMLLVFVLATHLEPDCPFTAFFTSKTQNNGNL